VAHAHGDEHCQGRDRGSSQHRGTVSPHPATLAGPVHCDSDGRQQRRPHRCADLAARVDGTADEALVAVSHPSGRRDHARKGSAGRAEADQHDRQERGAVATAGGQLSEDEETCCRRGASQDEQALRADAAHQACTEQPRAEADDALWGDHQPTGEGRVMQHLLKVEGQDEHLPAVPDPQQHHEGARVAQRLRLEEPQRHQRVRVMALDEKEAKSGRSHEGGRQQHRGRTQSDAPCL
jgi:hypothetical protein